MPPLPRHDILPLATAQIRPGPSPAPLPREAAMKAQAIQAQSQSQAGLTDGDGGYVFAAVLLTVGLIFLASCARLIRRQLKTPRRSVRDLALAPTGHKVRVRATVHSATPLEAGPDGGPSIYRRLGLMERQRRRHQDHYELVEIAAQPPAWAENCVLSDKGGQMPIQWGDVSPRAVERDHFYFWRHAENDPRVAELFGEFIDLNSPAGDHPRNANQILVQFIPNGCQLTLWGHCEEDFEAPGGRRFHVVEVDLPGAINFWSRVVFGVFLGIALCLGALLCGVQTFQTHEANAPIYTPTAGPSPLKP